MRGATIALFTINVIVQTCWAAAVPPASIIAVYPSGGTVHENLLRVSVRFASAQNPEVASEIALLRANGREIDGVFDKDIIWSADGKLLTLLLGPGRLKTGLIAHAAFGRALVEGEDVSLSVEGAVVKTWRVDHAYSERLDPHSWTLSAPPPMSERPVAISFGEPIDDMDVNYIVILGPDGKRIEGRAALAETERGWQFTPVQPWAAGTYQILVNPHLEDACGNSVSGPFEVPDDARPGKAVVVRQDLKIG